MNPNLPIIIKDKLYILKEAYVDLYGHTIWNIIDPKNENLLMVHTSKDGVLYVKFFKHCPISRECAISAITKICEILLERNLNPTINIHYTNTSLISLCTKIGFRKVKDIKHLYQLKKLNNKPI